MKLDLTKPFDRSYLIDYLLVMYNVAAEAVNDKDVPLYPLHMRDYGRARTVLDVLDMLTEEGVDWVYTAEPQYKGAPEALECWMMPYIVRLPADAKRPGEEAPGGERQETVLVNHRSQYTRERGDCQP